MLKVMKNWPFGGFDPLVVSTSFIRLVRARERQTKWGEARVVWVSRLQVGRTVVRAAGP